MTAADRVVQLLTDFLDDAPDRAPDQLLETILTDLLIAPQRAGWRSALGRVPMLSSNVVRYGAVAGVVFLAAIVAFSWWTGRGNPIGPPGDTLRPSLTVLQPTATPRATQTSTAAATTNP